MPTDYKTPTTGAILYSCVVGGQTQQPLRGRPEVVAAPRPTEPPLTTTAGKNIFQEKKNGLVAGFVKRDYARIA